MIHYLFKAKVNSDDGLEGKTTRRNGSADEPLHLAIKNGHYDAARCLLEHGANVNQRYFYGNEVNMINPLNTKFMELLLTYGAFPDARDRTGLTPLMKACRFPQV